MIRRVLVALVGSAALAAPAAHADSVYWSLNVGAPGVATTLSNAYPAPPVVYSPPPVYYAPPPALPRVYFAPPPRPVVYGYAPAYVPIAPGYLHRRRERAHWYHDHDRRDWDRGPRWDRR